MLPVLIICLAAWTLVYPEVNPLHGVPVGSTKVKAFVVTDVVVLLNVAAVPLRLKPCEAMSPWAVLFTVAV